jgi:hypothetical protein
MNKRFYGQQLCQHCVLLVYRLLFAAPHASYTCHVTIDRDVCFLQVEIIVGGICTSEQCAESAQGWPVVCLQQRASSDSKTASCLFLAQHCSCVSVAALTLAQASVTEKPWNRVRCLISGQQLMQIQRISMDSALVRNCNASYVAWPSCGYRQGRQMLQNVRT